MSLPTLENISRHQRENTTANIPGYTCSRCIFAHCYIRKNSVNKVRAYLDPKGCSYEEASNSAVLHLSRGDKVDIGGCSSVGSMWGWTSFSGFLLKAD